MSGVVGVNQQDRVRIEPDERPEGVFLVVPRLNEAVRHRPRHRQTIDLAGQDVRGCGNARDVKRSRRFDGGIRPVDAPGAEIDDSATARRGDHPCGLGGQGRLQVNLIDDKSFGELGFGNRCGDLEDRLVGENRRTLQDRVHIPCEAEVP